MKKLFLELPILFKDDELDDITTEQITDFSGLTPATPFINVNAIQTIEDDPFHGDEFCFIRIDGSAFVVPMPKEQLLDKIERFLNAPNT